MGDLPAEYRAFVEACALTSHLDRTAVRVSGERRAEMLNGLLTNQVSDLSESGRHALLLSPKGRVLTDLRVYPRPDHMLLDVPRKGLHNLLHAFGKYLPPLYATFEDVGDRLRFLSLYGPRAVAAVSRALGEIVPESHLGVRELDVDGAAALVIRDRRLAGDGVQFVVPGATATQLAERLLAAAQEVGGRAVGRRALEIVRVEWGIPEYGVDIDETNLAQETGLVDEAVSFEKGCYLGQEVVARVHFRGHVNRQLRCLSFADQAGPAGAALYDEQKEVGTVTSAVHSPDFGPIGLGYVRREVEPSSVLRWAHAGRSGALTVRDLPFRSV